eukprot:6456763-Amphidinium_carterae.4
MPLPQCAATQLTASHDMESLTGEATASLLGPTDPKSEAQTMQLKVGTLHSEEQRAISDQRTMSKCCAHRKLFPRVLVALHYATRRAMERARSPEHLARLPLLRPIIRLL